MPDSYGVPPTGNAEYSPSRIHWAPAGRNGSHCFLYVRYCRTERYVYIYAPDQYPLLSELALRIVLRAYLQEEIHEFLQRLRLARHDESYYVHEEAGFGVAVQHYGEDLLLSDCQTWCPGHRGAVGWKSCTMVSI